MLIQKLRRWKLSLQTVRKLLDTHSAINDGINDAWKIKSIASESSYTIDIFDRYGKFIKQLNPDDNSWDGTFNGLNQKI